MTTATHLYLDLEDTVIAPVFEGWANVHLVNVEKVKAWIQTIKPDFVHLFSFAIHTSHDRLLFNTYVRGRLEHALGIKLSGIPTTDEEIIPVVCKVLKLSTDYVTFTDVCDFCGKHEAFRLNMRHQWRGEADRPDADVQVVFLDDDVLNETFEWPDLKIKGRIVNVDTI